jgi:hypothetical protein
MLLIGTKYLPTLLMIKFYWGSGYLFLIGSLFPTIFSSTKFGQKLIGSLLKKILAQNYRSTTHPFN